MNGEATGSGTMIVLAASATTVDKRLWFVEAQQQGA
jgi:hypothetical protein